MTHLTPRPSLPDHHIKLPYRAIGMDLTTAASVSTGGALIWSLL